MHGHYAFWGAYAMIVLAIISYALPNVTGRKRYQSTTGMAAFWLSNVGMLGMTVAFGVAGVVQVYLERKMKMEFMVVQNEISIHFVVLLICATMFATGIGLFIYDFVKYGRPTDEALEGTHNENLSSPKIKKGLNHAFKQRAAFSEETK
jgi:nitric oxide reductase subunit B